MFYKREKGADVLEWIPVDECEPQIGQRILCTGLKLGLFVGYYRGTRLGFQDRVRYLSSLREHSFETREFVAWMPAPEPYKSREKYEEFMAIRAAYYRRLNELRYLSRKRTKRGNST